MPKDQGINSCEVGRHFNLKQTHDFNFYISSLHAEMLISSAALPPKGWRESVSLVQWYLRMFMGSPKQFFVLDSAETRAGFEPRMVTHPQLAPLYVSVSIYP